MKRRQFLQKSGAVTLAQAIAGLSWPVTAHAARLRDTSDFGTAFTLHMSSGVKVSGVAYGDPDEPYAKPDSLYLEWVARMHRNSAPRVERPREFTFSERLSTQVDIFLALAFTCDPDSWSLAIEHCQRAHEDGALTLLLAASSILAPIAYLSPPELPSSEAIDCAIRLSTLDPHLRLVEVTDVVVAGLDGTIGVDLSDVKRIFSHSRYGLHATGIAHDEDRASVAANYALSDMSGRWNVDMQSVKSVLVSITTDDTFSMKELFVAFDIIRNVLPAGCLSIVKHVPRTDYSPFLSVDVIAMGVDSKA